MIAVLNPGGRDPEQSFRDGAGAPDPAKHAPVNFHGFAACMNGSFHRTDLTIPQSTNWVVLVLRRDLKACRQALVELRALKKTVLITLKEAGAHQIAELLSDPGRMKLFRHICERADGAIATTPDALPIYRSAGARAVEFIPTPYPVEDERWDFSIPWEERSGIFIGTREFLVPSRNHLLALQTIREIAEPMYEPVTIFNVDGWRGRRLIESLKWTEGLLKVIPGRLSYPAYLMLMARHKIVFQLDTSAVPGQVAGDALLCRMPCVGGNGTTERLAFPDYCGHGRGGEELFQVAARLIEHTHDLDAAASEALSLAKERIGFVAVRKQLEDFFMRVHR